MSKLSRLLPTAAPVAALFIRAMAGAVFLSEGIHKFIDPVQGGAGRFAEIGLPAPEWSLDRQWSSSSVGTGSPR